LATCLSCTWDERTEYATALRFASVKLLSQKKKLESSAAAKNGLLFSPF
jgi:hypothetical protein